MFLNLKMLTVFLPFLKTFQKWWALHDVSSTAEFIRKRLPDKMPYYSIFDDRLSWLDKDMPFYLDNKWHSIIKNRLKEMRYSTKEDKARKKQEQMKIFTKETYSAVKFITKSRVYTV